MLGDQRGIPAGPAGQRRLFVWSVWCSKLFLLLHLAGVLDSVGMWISQDVASELGALPAQASSVTGSVNPSYQVGLTDYEEEPVSNRTPRGTISSWSGRAKTLSSSRTRAAAAGGKGKLALLAAALVPPIVLGLSLSGVRKSLGGRGVTEAAAATDDSSIVTGEDENGTLAQTEANIARLVLKGDQDRKLYKMLLITLIPAAAALLVHYLLQSPFFLNPPENREEVRVEDGGRNRYQVGDTEYGEDAIHYRDLQCPAGSDPNATVHDSNFVKQKVSPPKAIVSQNDYRIPAEQAVEDGVKEKRAE